MQTVDELRAILAAALERRAEHASDGHAEKGGERVRAVVDVTGEPKIGTASPDQRDRIRLEQQRGAAVLFARLGIEDPRRAEGQVKGLQLVRMLVQQPGQPIGGCAAVVDLEEHAPELGVRCGLRQ
jgi:hypothetical protein